MNDPLDEPPLPPAPLPPGRRYRPVAINPVAPRGRVGFRWSYLAASWGVRTGMAAVFASSRETLHGTDWLERECLVGGRPVIFACWHNCIIGAIRFMQRFVITRGRYACPVASPSRDGNAITYVLEDFAWHVEVIRGSSGRNGDDAMRRLKLAVEADRCPVLTVDGPRGPRYEAKPGAVRLARMTGAPIVPVSFATKRELRIASTWDCFRVPLPVNHVRYLVGPPLFVPPDVPDHVLPFWTARLTTRLQQLTAIADRLSAPGAITVGRDRGDRKHSPVDDERRGEPA